MKASNFSESQMAYVLRKAEDGTAIGELCRSAGIWEATFYKWRKKYGGLLPSILDTTDPSANLSASNLSKAHRRSR